MSDDNKDDVKLSLTVALNKEKNKVLYAVADSHFVDILLSFLTLPLGRIVKVLEKHYGDKAPTIGSLNSLYHGIANLDASHFWTEGAKKTLLDLISPFETEYCLGTMSKEVVEKSSTAASSKAEVFTRKTTSFIISDDLHILPSETGFLRIIGILGITDTDNSKSIKVELGFGEIMELLKASLTSPTPLSDVILKKTTRMNSAFLENQPKESYTTNSYPFTLKVMVQNSTGKLLYAQTKKDFIEFLFSLLYIPLGEVEHLMAGKTCFKAIDNLYRSTSKLIGDECFITSNSQSMKSRLMKPNVVHGCISNGNEHILRLNQVPLSGMYKDSYGQCLASSLWFPKGQGIYLQECRTYKVTDDLTVVPYCFVSILSSLREQKILLSDIKEVEVKIGFKEGLSILKASLTSTCALSHALFNHISNKQPKTEV